MKKQLLALLAATFVAAVGASPIRAQANKDFVLRGYMAGLPDSIRVELVDAENEKPKVICDTVPSNGRFILQGQIEHPTYCRIRFMRYSPLREGYATVSQSGLMLDNGELTFRCDLPLDSLKNSYQPELLTKIDGGPAQEEYKAAIRETAETELKAKKARYKEARKYFDSNANPDTVRKYLALTREAQAAHWQTRRNFIMQHPTYHISAFWVEKEMEKQFIYDENELRTLAGAVGSCPDTVRTSRIARKLDNALRYALGRMYPDFEATTPEHTSKALSEIVTPGRYTLIDFWASWCGPCRAAIPRVSKLYKQYEGKLTVCSVSLDEKEEKWRKAMEDEKMPWTQLWADDDQIKAICKAYYIESIPRLILLNDKGEIVCSTLRPDDISDYLKQHVNL